MDRRAFLQGSATLLAGAGLGLTPAFAAPVELSRALFEGLQGTMFGVLAQRQVSYVALSEIRDASSDPALDQFTLVFDHVSGPTPGTDTHDVWHLDIGVFALHLEESGQPGRYVAVFSLPAA